MIEYVIAHDPDDRVVDKAKELLLKGELVCLPTDTNWSVVADPYNKDAVAKLYSLKKETPQKHFSLLVNEISKASEVAIIDDAAFKLLRRSIPGHYTFIFEATKKIAKTLKASKQDKEIGLRFVPSVLTDRLLNAFERPLIGSRVPGRVKEGHEGVDEIYSYMIEDKIGHMLGMIIDPGEVEFAGPSTIVSFAGEGVEIDRVGAGDPSPFQR